MRIQHYHVDNGHFAGKGFVNHCQDENQTLTYCGVNAHFQNGVAEKKIRDLQEKTQTCLLYAMHRWPRMIIANLWPYTLRYVNDVANETPNKGEEITPLEKFSSVSVAPKIRHFRFFGCQAYVGIMLCRVVKDFPNSHQAPDLEFTLVHTQIMEDQWH